MSQQQAMNPQPMYQQQGQPAQAVQLQPVYQQQPQQQQMYQQQPQQQQMYQQQPQQEQMYQQQPQQQPMYQQPQQGQAYMVAPTQQQIAPMQQMGTGQPHMQPTGMIAAPVSQQMGVAGALDQVLASSSSIRIKQRVLLWEAASGGCCDQNNVYDGFNASNQLVFTAVEDSGCFERVCCAPYQGYKMKVFLAGTDPTGDQPAYTIERQGACSGKMCLCCIPCTDSCADEVKLYKGLTPGEIGEADPSLAIFSAQQEVVMNAMCSPTVNVVKKAGAEPAFRVNGPGIFGGCLDLCIESEFNAVTDDGKQIGHMRKLKPNGCCEILTEMCTKSDSYEMHFDTEATVDQRLALLTSSILVDYMFFESDTGMIDCSDKSCGCNLFMCYCCGCIIPCKIVCPTGGEGEGEGGGGHGDYDGDFGGDFGGD